MKLEWSRYAINDRNAIFDYIERENPHAAAVVDNRIGQQIALLKCYAESGRIGRVENTRELVIDRTPYIAAYRILDDTVRILRILHGAQQWPDDIQDY